MNTSEMANREKKAVKLAEILYLLRATAEDVLKISEDEWKKVAQAATIKFEEHTNPPNKDNPEPTISCVLALLARKYADEAMTKDADNVVAEWLGEPKPAQQEADEAAEAVDKAEAKWEENQEYGVNRTPTRE